MNIPLYYHPAILRTRYILNVLQVSKTRSKPSFSETTPHLQSRRRTTPETPAIGSSPFRSRESRSYPLRVDSAPFKSDRKPESVTYHGVNATSQRYRPIGFHDPPRAHFLLAVREELWRWTTPPPLRATPLPRSSFRVHPLATESNSGGFWHVIELSLSFDFGTQSSLIL